MSYDGTDVVHDAALVLKPGEVTALVGPNGSGKSTLLRTVARLQKPRHGTLTLDAGTADAADGFDLTARQFARRVALLTQSRPTPGGLPVRDVVEFGRYPYRGRWGRADAEGPEVVDRVLESTGVTALADRGVDQLSGGQLQRVWLASCLAQQTGVLLLDEPTTYLDLAHQVDLLDLLTELNRTRGTTVVMVLHELNLAARYADHLVVMSAGQVVAQGRPGDVLTAASVHAAFGLRSQVVPDPVSGTPLVVPLGRTHVQDPS